MAELVLAVTSPYGFFVALSAAALSALIRHRVLVIVSLLLTVATLSSQVPWYFFADPTDVGKSVEIRIMSSNLRKGQADSQFFVAVATSSADIVTVSELTSDAVRRLTDAGIGTIFPYNALVPAPDAGGIGIWSRFPLIEVLPAKRADLRVVAARCQVPGVRFAPLFTSIHITSPVASDRNAFAKWRDGIASAAEQLASYADIVDPSAVIVGGDFNSTPDMRQFRDLSNELFRDAVVQTGAGFAPTFPSNEWYPSLITIDHVLTRRASASSVRTIQMPGSDHRALLASVDVPVDPTAS